MKNMISGLSYGALNASYQVTGDPNPSYPTQACHLGWPLPRFHSQLREWAKHKGASITHSIPWAPLGQGQGLGS